MHVYPSAISRFIIAVYIDSVYSTLPTGCKLVITGRICPSFESRIALPLWANAYATPAIVFVTAGTWTLATLLHGAPHSIEPVRATFAFAAVLVVGGSGSGCNGAPA